ncbi:MAG: hypothetical protein Q8L44_15355 [Sulfuritalea sp.]|nr:hypothetical protein [Sulfuritalea sp.]
MIPRLNEIVGLPLSTSPAEMDRASEAFFQELLGKASGGDADAQRQLVALRVAHLNWAYANQGAGSMTGNPNVLSAVAGRPGGSPAFASSLRWS